MRAANTAGSAAATQPAAKPRLKRAMKAHLVLLWNLVGEAGAAGITVEALAHLMPGTQAKKISSELSYLRTLEYVDVSGGRAKGARWRVTGVPVGQQPPEWMRAAEMPRRPSSVFALAAAPVPADWTLKGRRTPPPAGAKLLDDDDDDDQAEGVDIDAAHTRPKPGSTASELGWVAPTVATTATEPPPYLPERASAPYEPHFALHSDGTFEIHDQDPQLSDPIVLQPSTTRALFRWLDHLGGTHLSRTVAAA